VWYRHGASCHRVCIVETYYDDGAEPYYGVRRIDAPSSEELRQTTRTYLFTDLELASSPPLGGKTERTKSTVPAWVRDRIDIINVGTRAHVFASLCVCAWGNR
jgi:hypothetical protein